MLGEPKLTYLPDETVFSLIGRQHRLWGFSNTGCTARILFGDERCRVRHDFPRALDTFSTRMDGAAGSVLDAALEHTMLRYYMPFQSEEVGQRALQGMRGLQGASATICLALKSSSFGGQHPLKACRTCMREDLVKYGWTYWQLRHQFPGVWVCPLHEEPLMVLAGSLRPKEGGAWLLPKLELLSGDWAARIGDQEIDCLAKFASMTICAVETAHQNSEFCVRKISLILIEKLKKIGWLSEKSGRMKVQDAARSWLRYWQPIRCAPDFQVMYREGRREVLPPLVQPRFHPLHLLLAIDWLVGDLDDVVSACSHQEAQSMGRRAASDRWGLPLEQAVIWHGERVLRQPLYNAGRDRPFALKRKPPPSRLAKKNLIRISKSGGVEPLNPTGRGLKQSKFRPDVAPRGRGEPRAHDPQTRS